MDKTDRKNKADKKRDGFLRGVKIFFFFFVSFALLAVLAGGSFFAYTYYHTDYEGDELLFEMAKGSRTTRLFYDASRSGETREHDIAGSLFDTGASIPERSKVKGLGVGYLPRELEGERLQNGETRIFCSYEEIPDDLKNAFVAIEDHRFFTHNGVDWIRTARAVANYFLGFDSRFGASTITQQLIKNISSDNELSAERKLREICRALHLETHHSKEEILELYLNIVPLSEGCVGVGAAADVYFGKTPSELSLAECATIAAVTNLPRYYDPVAHEEQNRTRRELILHEMLRFGMINEEEYKIACQESICARGASRKENVYSWYTETVIDDVAGDLCGRYGYTREVAEKMIFGGGLSIYTLQDIAIQGILESYFSDLSNFPDAAKNGLTYAMTVVDPASGDLLGVVGGVGTKRENRILNYATGVKRAPGSALKPLSVYGPALEERLVTWGSVFDDVPVRFSKEGDQYTAWPQNEPSVYSGLTDLADAVAYSKNTVSVRVLERLGVERSYDYLTKRLGFDSLVRSEAGKDGTVTDLAPAPLALGQLSHGVSVRDMTEAYAAFAAGGVYHKGRSYALVLDANGKTLLENESHATRAFRPAVASIMTKLLAGVTERGTARILTLPATVDAVGKTGTSGAGQDKWFVGYTPYLVAGIWCGYSDGKTVVPRNAATSHLRVYDAVMKEMHARYADEGGRLRSFSQDHRLISAVYCRDSGSIPCEICRKDPRGGRSAIGYFERGSEPHALCTTHVPVPYDRTRGGVLCGESITRSFGGNSRKEDVGLIQVEGRDFPMEIYVTDAQYVYRSLPEGMPPSDSRDKPFFVGMIEKGHFVGISPTADGSQFNAGAKAALPEEDLRRFFEKYLPKILKR